EFTGASHVASAAIRKLPVLAGPWDEERAHGAIRARGCEYLPRARRPSLPAGPESEARRSVSRAAPIPGAPSPAPPPAAARGARPALRAPGGDRHGASPPRWSG